MQAPDFWRGHGPLAAPIARLLEPFAALYGAAGVLRARCTTPAAAGVPVLCVGNAVAGGAGKTPVALDLLARLPGAHALLRGYGGTERGPHRVDVAADSWERVGDEALLLAAAAPTWVARDRVAGARAAAAAGARAVVLDDGLQNPALGKDLSLLVIDGGYGFGNRRLIPAGPLRESLDRAIAKVQAAVLIGDDEARAARWLPAALPLLRARLRPHPADAARLAGRRVVAFAGIGRPGKFFASLRALGAEVIAAHPFADHYPYAPADIQPILDEAFALGALPVTTAKDAVRLCPDQRQQVDILRVALAWEDEAALDAVLAPLRARMEAADGTP